MGSPSPSLAERLRPRGGCGGAGSVGRRAAPALAFLLLATSCASSPATPPKSRPASVPPPAASAAPPPASPAPLPAPSTEAYRIGAGDLLRIEVFDDPKLSGDFPVGADGTVMFPLLGPVDSEGRTTAELKTKLTELLDRDYIFNPKVAVSIREYRSQKVRLLGSVGKPGIYFLEGPTRLFDLLSKAEGVSRDLGEIRRGQSVRIVRPRPGEAGGSTPVETIVVDLHDLLVAGREEANVAIRSGDVIYVAQSESIHVVGEVRRPGTFPYEAGMTVLKATSLAGGATKKGTLRGAIVRRIRNGREVEIEVKPEDLLEPEDVLDIPVSFW